MAISVKKKVASLYHDCRPKTINIHGIMTKYCTVFNPANFTCNHQYLLFCDVPPTWFSPCRPSSGRSFTREYT